MLFSHDGTSKTNIFIDFCYLHESIACCLALKTIYMIYSKFVNVEGSLDKCTSNNSNRLNITSHYGFFIYLINTNWVWFCSWLTWLNLLFHFYALSFLKKYIYRIIYWIEFNWFWWQSEKHTLNEIRFLSYWAGRWSLYYLNYKITKECCCCQSDARFPPHMRIRAH